MLWLQQQQWQQQWQEEQHQQDLCQYSLGPWRGATATDSDCSDDDDEEDPGIVDLVRDGSDDSDSEHQATTRKQTGKKQINISLLDTEDPNADNNNNNNNIVEGIPSPWGKGKTKQRIINELKNETSDIHLLIGDFDSSSAGCVNINYLAIRDKYASSMHDMKKFRPNIKRLIESMRDRKGPFKVDVKALVDDNGINIEPWYTSATKLSLGYTLLHDMYRFNASDLSNMKAEQIWRSHRVFQSYPLKDFKKYNTNMKALIAKRSHQASVEEALFKEDMQRHQKKQTTCRNTPFWNTHEAKKLLMKDVRDGIDKTMAPKDLWLLRKEYQEFPLDSFRQHIYDIRSKQVAGPYWQVKRNKNAMKLHRIETDRMRKEWAEGIELEDRIGRLTIDD